MFPTPWGPVSGGAPPMMGGMPMPAPGFAPPAFAPPGFAPPGLAAPDFRDGHLHPRGGFQGGFVPGRRASFVPGMGGPVRGMGGMPGGFQGLPFQAPQGGNMPGRDRAEAFGRGTPGKKFDPSRFQRAHTPSEPGKRHRRVSFNDEDEVIPRRSNSHDREERMRGELDAEDALAAGYDYVKKLKAGGMSDAIHLVQSRSNGKLYIEKRIRADSPSGNRAYRELKTLEIITKKYGRGGNLNTFVAFQESRSRLIAIVLDYCEGGSLAQKLDGRIKSGEHFNEVTLLNVLQGVASGLAFLHDGITKIQPGKPAPKPHDWDSICHLDLKPQNIFLTKKGGIGGLSRVVLADFGCAVTLSDIINNLEPEHMQLCGTPAWYPPEGDNQQGYGTKTDIWQLGTTIHCLARLRQAPSKRTLRTGDERACGSRYSQVLNDSVAGLAHPQKEMRPAARKVASGALKELLSVLKTGAKQPKEPQRWY